MTDDDAGADAGIADTASDDGDRTASDRGGATAGGGSADRAGDRGVGPDTDRGADAAGGGGHRRSTTTGFAPATDRSAAVGAGGRVRRWVRARSARFGRLQGVLDRARLGTPFDAYLARTARGGALAGVVGLLAGAVVGWRVHATGGVPGVGAVPAASLVAWLLPVAAALLLAGLVAGGRLAYPRLVAARRRRDADAALSEAVLFLYALVHGGVGVHPALRTLAEAESYGAVAAEFAVVVTDVERLGMDVYAALGHAREVAPSDDLGTLFDELASVLESGGDVEDFLAGQVDKQLEAAEEAHERLVDDLGVYSHVYVATVFAGPTFLVVVLLVMSFAGRDVLAALRFLVYVLVPAGVVVFTVGFRWYLRPYREPSVQPAGGEASAPEEAPTAERASATGDASTAVDDPRFEAYRRARRRTNWRERLREPVASLEANPRAVLAVTVPATGLVLGALVATGWLPLPWRAGPVVGTTAYAAGPFLASAAPLSVLHERKRDRQLDARSRLPAAVSVLADADRNGLELAESFRLVAERTGGPLGEQFGRLHADLAVTDDAVAAVRRFGERSDVPTVRRTAELLSASIRATDDLAPVLEAVADDVGERERLRRERREELGQFVVIVVVGVLVYVGILAMLDVFFLPVVQKVGTRAGRFPRADLPVTDLSTATYVGLFYHAALVQAVGNGLLLGVLIDDRLASGLRYAVPLVAVTTFVFHLVHG